MAGGDFWELDWGGSRSLFASPLPSHPVDERLLVADLPFQVRAFLQPLIFEGRVPID
jgi:hypothetical protein